MTRPVQKSNWKICYADLVKNLRLIVIASAFVTLIGCSAQAPSTTSTETGAAAASGAAGGSGAVAIKRYSMHGKVVSVDMDKKVARIDGGAIGDWMGPMTMNVTVKDDTLAGVKAGDVVDTTVFVQGDDFWIGEIKPSK